MLLPSKSLNTYEPLRHRDTAHCRQIYPTGRRTNSTTPASFRSTQRQARQGWLFSPFKSMRQWLARLQRISRIGLSLRRSSSKPCPGGWNLTCTTRCRTMHRSAPARLPRKGRTLRVALQIEVADVHAVRRKASNLGRIDRDVERLATRSIGATARSHAGNAAARSRRRVVRIQKMRALKGSRSTRDVNATCNAGDEP